MGGRLDSVPALEAELERLNARASALEHETTQLAAIAAVAAHELLEPDGHDRRIRHAVSERLQDSPHAASCRQLDILTRDAARLRVLVETLASP